MTKQPEGTGRFENERRLLERYACRWAVLAAWQQDLNKRAVALPPGVNAKLVTARTKITSGTFSACEVGCDLGQIEAILVSADVSSLRNAAEDWLALLATAMDESMDVEHVLQVPSVKFHFVNCNLPCKCDE